MKTFFMSSLGLIGALALAGAAFAQVPTSNDTSTTDGKGNTGMGTGALGGPTPVNLTGGANTASGFNALTSNTTGNDNTASGVAALAFNTSGNDNTASGAQALNLNTSGGNNTAAGVNALYSNTDGDDNTAAGFQALFSNTTGSWNTATGKYALYSNTTGNNNTASGVYALFSNTTGGDANTASGVGALYNNTTGSYNIAMGYVAGQNLTTGSNNIDIGSVGVAGESNTIRIGTKGTHKVTVIAGINSSKITGNAVYVTTTGRLGVLASSERFKTAIAPMGSNSAKLEQLRPVSFHLKADPKGALQYGLIAEEVAKVYPDLVIRDEKGRIDGARYDELAPMLLNEAQQQKQKFDAQAAEIRDLKQQVAELKDLKQELRTALIMLQAKDTLVAER